MRNNGERERLIALVGGQLIDGTGRPPIVDATVLIAGKRIIRVGQGIAVPEGAEVIDVRGKTILPGLVDFHGHLYARATPEMRSQFEAYPKLYLAGGVTTVRTPGDFDPAGTVQLREQIAHGEVIGPRVFTAGPYFDHAPSSVQWIVGIESVETALAKFDEWRDQIDEVKVYTRIREDEFSALADAAHAAGLPIAAHLGSITATRAIELGIDRLEHAIFAMPELYGGPENEQIGDAALAALAALDLDGPLVQGLIEQIVANNVTICPTTTVFQLDAPGFLPVIPDWERYFSPAAVIRQREMLAMFTGTGPERSELICGALRKQAGFVKRLHDAGATVIPGTDPVAPLLVPGYGLHLELKNFVEAGISPLATIKAATLDAARALRADHEFGSVERGKLADLVVVDGDPAQRIEDIGRVSLVMAEGVVHDPAELRRAAEGALR